METKFIEITKSENYDLAKPELINRTKLKSDFAQYKPTSLTGVNTPNSIIKISIPREDVFIDIGDSYLELEVDVLKAADNRTQYADGDTIQPNNLFGISLFHEMSLSTFGNKNLERVDQCYLASLMYKLLSDNEKDMIIVYIEFRTTKSLFYMY